MGAAFPHERISAEIVIRSGNTVLAVFPLPGGAYGLFNRGMEAATLTSGAIAGSIRPVDPLLATARKAWRDDMERLKYKPATVRHFIRYLDLCTAHSSWVTVGQVCHRDAVKFLAAMVKPDPETGKARWQGTTHDGAASALKVFGDFLEHNGYVVSNPLNHLEKSGETCGLGSRAFVTDECRALVSEARDWQKRDKKIKAPLLVYFLFLCLTAIRPGAVGKVRRCDVDVGDKPAIYGDPTWLKNGKRMRIPINNELAGVLREYLKGVPEGPEALLFPVRPNHHTFERLLVFAGIRYQDERMMPATPYSCRHWMATQLDRIGASPGIVSMVLAHTTTMAEKHYLDRLESEAREYLNKLPALLPTETYGVDNPVDKPPPAPVEPGNVENGLTSRVTPGDYVSVQGRVPHGPSSQAAQCPFRGSDLGLVAEALEGCARLVGLAASALKSAASAGITSKSQ